MEVRTFSWLTVPLPNILPVAPRARICLGTLGELNAIVHPLDTRPNMSSLCTPRKYMRKCAIVHQVNLEFEPAQVIS
jgi:hypothetical protein